MDLLQRVRTIRTASVSLAVLMRAAAGLLVLGLRHPGSPAVIDGAGRVVPR